VERRRGQEMSQGVGISWAHGSDLMNARRKRSWKRIFGKIEIQECSIEPRIAISSNRNNGSSLPGKLLHMKTKRMIQFIIIFLKS